MPVSRSLELPEGYQSYEWYHPGECNPHGVTLDDPDSMKDHLRLETNDLYLYTHHEVFLDDGIIKQTRSSPNWEGGMVTYSTCKHNMRTFNRPWVGTWLAGLGPSHCESNCLMFVGQIWKAFPGNYTLQGVLQTSYPQVAAVKRAAVNPRGDLYTPKRKLNTVAQMHDHSNFVAPLGHTRSVEFYKKSPGSIATRKDGLVPKWWRDLEYLQRGRRPPVFILSPCWLFSTPLLWTTRQPRRAVIRTTTRGLVNTLRSRVPRQQQAT